MEIRKYLKDKTKWEIVGIVALKITALIIGLFAIVAGVYGIMGNNPMWVVSLNFLSGGFCISHFIGFEKALSYLEKTFRWLCRKLYRLFLS